MGTHTKLEFRKNGARDRWPLIKGLATILRNKRAAYDLKFSANKSNSINLKRIQPFARNTLKS
ncbi:hypothetical protein CH380_09245 [Leptospira adleri]|uniref:Uncharacterized protein n=1 Tax=Leptospira adleri TaxID=2023186 RepID=A0A2M9YQD7_9LEPT|nr:hypothetical protein CH380_09245 [Leptospira adleri]PJZ59786.1 hypothetical protein CH376_21825 [Leptospira adleri]